MRRLFRSSAFRLAVGFAAIVFLTACVVFDIVYVQFYSANVALVRSLLEDDIRQTQDASTEQLRKKLELRLTQDLRHLDYVGLYDRQGSLMFGNVDADLTIPADGKAHLVRTHLPNAEAWQGEATLLIGIRRRDGGTLILGRSLIYVDQLDAAMLKGFEAAIVPVILFALLAGVIISVRALRRLSTIQHAIDRVMQGDLLVRLPARRRPDDIDELVRSVNTMLDEIVRLLNQLKSVGDNIAHDLRAPLAVMRARLERGLAGGSEQVLRTLTAEALTDLDRAMITVAALLRIADLESGVHRGSFNEIDLVAICRDAFELYDPLAQAKGVSMSLVTPNPVLVTGDGDLLREALLNLVDNAVKFTPVGGSITIACGMPDALIRVSDSGPGIAICEREKILERFYRSPTTQHISGTGIGLSMAKTIIDLHGFGLHVRDNEPGTIFEVTAAKVSMAKSWTSRNG